MLILFVIYYFVIVFAELNVYLVKDKNDFKFLTPGYPNPSDVDFPEEKMVFTTEKGNAIQIGCKRWETRYNAKDCDHVDMMITDLKNAQEKRFCGDDICNDVSYISGGHELQVTFSCSEGNVISWYAKSVKASTTTKKPTTTTKKPTTTTKKAITTTKKTTTTTKKPTTTTKKPTTTTEKPTTTTKKPTTTTTKPTTTTKKPTTTTKKPTTTTRKPTTTTQKPTTTTKKATTEPPPFDDEYEPIRNVTWRLVPGQSKVVTNPGFKIPMVGEGDIRYTFIGKKGYEILASCEDDYRPSVNFINPCESFTVTFDDGAYRKQFCTFLWLTETYYTTNRSILNFQMNYTEGGSSIVRCVFRTTEPFAEPTKIIQVPKDTAINSPKRDSFSEDFYLIQGQNGKPFNLDCQFKDTQNSYCILSRVIMKVDNIEMFCLGREYRRKNITKAELRVYSDGNGWPEIYCTFSVGSTSKPNTPRTPPYGKKPRRDYTPRKEETKKWILKAGETKEFVAQRDANNVLILNVEVAKGYKVYVFCHEYKPFYDGSLPCDPFAIKIEESRRLPEFWCSRRHLESLGYISNGPKLKLTVENFAKGNKVTCAVRSTEPPSPEKEISVTKKSPTFSIVAPTTKQPYMNKRWIIQHPENGALKVKCNHNILRSVYSSRGRETIKRQYYCYQRRIEVNEDFECEIREPPNNAPIEFVAFEKADVIIMTDKGGLAGHLCNVTAEF